MEGSVKVFHLQVLALMLEVLELLKPLADQWGSDKTLLHALCNERESAQHDYLVSAAKDLQQAWRRSLHCRLQLNTRLKNLLDLAVGVEQDGGILGKEKPILKMNRFAWFVFFVLNYEC